MRANFLQIPNKPWSPKKGLKCVACLPQTLTVQFFQIPAIHFLEHCKTVGLPSKRTIPKLFLAKFMVFVQWKSKGKCALVLNPGCSTRASYNGPFKLPSFRALTVFLQDPGGAWKLDISYRY